MMAPHGKYRRMHHKGSEDSLVFSLSFSLSLSLSLFYPSPYPLKAQNSGLPPDAMGKAQRVFQGISSEVKGIAVVSSGMMSLLGTGNRFLFFRLRSTKGGNRGPSSHIAASAAQGVANNSVS